ncbi:11155_t:CDS:2 [Cetraspora pellucida]|uniref:11155_t:CDS:1 n=1 Tax=Cetraspora pellucida TaxID=1433469 RepID=A0ACA9KYK1_9GLOM|nr:11155_t:CDS:2 [Cetraspora pellucida]
MINTKEIIQLLQLCQQNHQELVKIIWKLKEEIKILKEEQPIVIDNPIDFEKKHQRLKEILNYLLQQEEIKTGELNNLLEKKDLNKATTNIAATKDLVEGLSNLKKTNQKLKKQLDYFEQLRLNKETKIKQKKEELERLKNSLLAKVGNYDKEKLQKKLAKLLEFQVDMTIHNASSAFKEGEEIKDKLTKKTLIFKSDLDNVCHLQGEITQLESSKKGIKKVEKTAEELKNNNMVEPNKSNQDLINNEQPSITTDNIDTKQGNSNLGNRVGDNANLGYERIGKQFNNSGDFRYGQNNFGDHNQLTQITNANTDNNKLQQLVNKAKNEIDKLNISGEIKNQLKRTLYSIRVDIRKDTKVKIDNLGKELGNLELIQEICQAEEKEVNAKQALMEQPPKK